jgi:hypothetical protein
MNTLKKHFKNFNFIGHEEDFTNYCFRYGVIIKDYRNEIERNTIFEIHGKIAEVVIINGRTQSIKI